MIEEKVREWATEAAQEAVAALAAQVAETARVLERLVSEQGWATDTSREAVGMLATQVLGLEREWAAFRAEISGRLAHPVRARRKDFGTRRSTGVSPMGLVMLDALACIGTPLTTGDLVTLTGMAQASVNSTMSRLYQGGWVERDGRPYAYSLAAKGLALTAGQEGRGNA